jgi:hypothetical protein
MPGIQHHFVHGVRADTDVQYAVTVSGTAKYQDLFIPQSSIDAACGLHSVLVAKMILSGIPRFRIDKISTATRDPLRALWLQARETYFEGTEEHDIERYVSALPGLTCDTVTSMSARRIGSSAAKAVANGGVPMIRFRSRNWSHWATVIGVEVIPGEAGPRALLMLDSSAPRPWGSFFNTRLQLQAQTSTGRFCKPFVLPYRYCDGDLHAVHLQSVVVIQRDQPP